MKICSGCGKKIDASIKGNCNECKKKRNKEYNKARVDDPKERLRQKFYMSKDWRNLRNYIMHKYFSICIHCFIVNKIHTRATTVHHIKSTKDYWEERLKEKNLIPVCDSCHRIIELEYLKDERKKRAMMDKLTRCLKVFNDIYTR